MLLNQGDLYGVRILGRKTVELMTANHMPNNGDLSSMGMPVFSETPYDGVGFGLGVSVMLDPAKAHILGSPVRRLGWCGEHGVLGRSGRRADRDLFNATHALVEEPIWRELRVLTYGAIVD